VNPLHPWGHIVYEVDAFVMINFFKVDSISLREEAFFMKMPGKIRAQL